MNVEKLNPILPRKLASPGEVVRDNLQKRPRISDIETSFYYLVRVILILRSPLSKLWLVSQRFDLYITCSVASVTSKRLTVVGLKKAKQLLNVLTSISAPLIRSLISHNSGTSSAVLLQRDWNVSREKASAWYSLSTPLI